MAISTALITGRIIRPGTDIGIRARVTATPQTTAAALKFSTEDVITWGPVVVETDDDGNLPDFRIPLGSDSGDSVLWRFTAESLDRLPGVPKTWSITTAFVTTSTPLTDLANVELTVTTPEVVEDVGALVVQAEAAAAAAEAVGTLADTQIAGRIEDPASATAQALSASFASITVSPLAFGADPTGANDSGPAIRAALASLPNDGSLAVVDLGPGEFKVCATQRTLDPLSGGSVEGDAVILRRSNLVLRGAGKDATRIVFRGYGDTDPETAWQLVGGKVFRGSGISLEAGNTEATRLTNVTVEGLTLDGSCDYTADKDTYPANPTTGDGWDPTHKGLRILNNKMYRDITFRDIRITRWRGEAAHHAGLNEVRNIRATGMEITDCIEGWCVEGTAYFQGRIAHCTTHGIEHWTQTEDALYDAVVEDVQQIAFYGKYEPLVVPFGSVTIAPTSRFLRCDKGVATGGLRRVSGRGFVVEDATTRGIEVLGKAIDIDIDAMVRNRTRACGTGLRLGTDVGSRNVRVRTDVMRTDEAVQGGFAFTEGQNYTTLENVAAGTLDLSRNRSLGTQFLFTDQAESVDRLLTTTTSTTVARIRPARAGLYVVHVYLRVVGAPTNVTLQVDFTDAGGPKGERMASQVTASETTSRRINALSVPVGSFLVAPMTIQATGDAETKYVAVNAIAGTANQVYVSASIREVA